MEAGEAVDLIKTQVAPVLAHRALANLPFLGVLIKAGLAESRLIIRLILRKWQNIFRGLPGQNDWFPPEGRIISARDTRKEAGSNSNCSLRRGGGTQKRVKKTNRQANMI
jgi:hypothetical protein